MPLRGRSTGRSSRPTPEVALTEAAPETPLPESQVPAAPIQSRPVQGGPVQSGPVTVGTVLELDRVTKRFGRVSVADELSLEVRADELIGVVGPNGAGKSSLFSIISGDLAPDRGRVLFRGRLVNHLDAASRCRLGIGRTYQVPRPFEQMTVFENVLVAAQAGAGLRARTSPCAGLLRPLGNGPGRRRQPAGRRARAARPQTPGVSPGFGHGAAAATAGRSGGRPDRPGSRPADRYRAPGTGQPG